MVKAAGKLDSELETVGISLDELLNNAGGTARKLFILAMDLERVLEAGYSGVDTGGGKALLFDVKGMTTACKRVDIVMHHEAVISIMESGVHVSY